MAGRLISARYIAYRLGIRTSAVGNWLTRGVLPPDCQPAYRIDHGTPWPTAVWAPDQLPLITAWYNAKHKKEG